MIWEANNALLGIPPSLGTYLEKRPFLSGVYACFDLIEVAQQTFLSPEMQDNFMLQRLQQTANNIVAWSNDILGLNRDRKEGNTNNLVLVLQHEPQKPLAGAIARAVQLHNDEVQTFINLEAQLLSANTANLALIRYLSGLRYWMRGSLDWHLESMRYRMQVA